MLSFLKSKKKLTLTDNVKRRIEKEVEQLTSLPEGIYVKSKEFELGHYVTIIIDKKKLSFDLNFDNENFVVPDFITFLLIMDFQFPLSPPRILTKTNFCFPTLMDGRDLMDEIFHWTEKSSILEVIKNLPHFIHRISNTKAVAFYGKFHLGAIYEMKNFNNMLVSVFGCKFENEKQKDSNEEFNLSLVLSEDAIILFEKYDNSQSIGKLIFWSTLYSVTDMQLNKVQKIVSIDFYNDDKGDKTNLNLRIDNILLFRDLLTKRMSGLKVRVDAKKIPKGKPVEKQLTDKDISQMKIDMIRQTINLLVDKIDKGEINYYNVNTFMTLCGKAVEHYSAANDQNHMTYLDLMKRILTKEEVQRVVYGDNSSSSGNTSKK